MLDDFLAIGRRIDIENEVIKESNKIINKVKDLLSKSSALSPVENFNILSVAENFYAVSLFNDICNKSKLEKRPLNIFLLLILIVKSSNPRSFIVEYIILGISASFIKLSSPSPIISISH